MEVAPWTRRLLVNLVEDSWFLLVYFLRDMVFGFLWIFVSFVKMYSRSRPLLRGKCGSQGPRIGGHGLSSERLLRARSPSERPSPTR